MFFRPGENPCASGRIPQGSGRMCISGCSIFYLIVSIVFTKHIKRPHPKGCGPFLFGGKGEFEEAGLCAAEVKNMPGACFLGRGKIHAHPDASRREADGCA